MKDDNHWHRSAYTSSHPSNLHWLDSPWTNHQIWNRWHRSLSWHHCCSPLTKNHLVWSSIIIVTFRFHNHLHNWYQLLFLYFKIYQHLTISMIWNKVSPIELYHSNQAIVLSRLMGQLFQLNFTLRFLIHFDFLFDFFQCVK